MIKTNKNIQNSITSPSPVNIPKFETGKFENELIENCEQDYFLLLVLIIIESYQKKINTLGLESFYKYEYWKNQPYSPTIIDNELYDGPMPSKIFFLIFWYLNLVSIKTVTITKIKPNDLIKIIKLVKSEDSKLRYFNPNYYSQAINYTNEILFKIINPDEKTVLDNSFNQYFSLIRSILPYANFFSRIISFKLKYNKPNIKKTKNIINSIINNFTNDRYENYTSKLKLPFKVQIDNFYKYINTSHFKKNTKYIHITTLNCSKFEIIKILKYLELNKIISVNSWDEQQYWKITFHKDPQDQVTYFPPPKSNPYKLKSQITIKIDKEGTISKVNSELSYSLGTNNRHYEIIKYFVDKKDYIKTKIISKEAPPPNPRKTNKLQEPENKDKSTREAIGKINKIFREKLEINNFITNKQGIGYKINDNYQISVG